MVAVTFTESRPTAVLAKLHASAKAEREYLFASHDASDRDLILVAWYGNDAVGYIATTDMRDDGLLIWEHVVVPEFRGQGIGRRLLLEAAKRTTPGASIIIDPMGELAIDRIVDYYARLGFPSTPHNGQITATAGAVLAKLQESRENTTAISEVLKDKPPGIVTVDPSADVATAIALMNDMRIGAVVASTDGSRVEGILSERDILVGLDRHGDDFLSRPIGDCTTGDVVTATTTDLVVDAMVTMTSRRVRHLPITDTGRLVGIISVGDLLLFRLRHLDSVTYGG